VDVYDETDRLVQLKNGVIGHIRKLQNTRTMPVRFCCDSNLPQEAVCDIEVFVVQVACGFRVLKVEVYALGIFQMGFEVRGFRIDVDNDSSVIFGRPISYVLDRSHLRRFRFIPGGGREAEAWPGVCPGRRLRAAGRDSSSSAAAEPLY